MRFSGYNSAAQGAFWLSGRCAHAPIAYTVLQVYGGQILLMDAGCEFFGYASDVTRTWPVDGRYTPEQRRVYETVLSVRQR